MDDEVAFTIGEAMGNHLRLTVLRRFSGSPEDWFDFGGLECRVDIKTEGMHADFVASLRAEGLEKLRDDLAELDREFAPGTVQFEPAYERAIVFGIGVGPSGTISIGGTAIDGYGRGAEQKLVFGFAVEDSLRAVLSSADAVVRAFPRSPKSTIQMSRAAKPH